MTARARRRDRRPRRRPEPLVGFQHGRGARIVRQFPMLHGFFYGLSAHTTPRLYLVGAVGVGPAVFLLMSDLDYRSTTIGFAVIAWMCAAVTAGWFLRPRLWVEARLPARVACGGAFETRYRVRNTGRRPARSVSVETLTYSDWMRLRIGSVHVEELAPGEEATLTGRGRALGRGLYTLPALRWDTDFPCGFWRWGRTDPKERTLAIYPQPAVLASFDIPLGVRQRQELSASAKLSREAFEFHGCREFRDGDALRHVHPRSSARVGAPVVKEYQAQGRARTAILVDIRDRGWLATVRGRLRRNDTGEAALALVTAMAEELAATDRTLELLVAGPEVYRFVSAGRTGYLEDVLDILAAVEPCRADPLDRLAPLLLDEIRDIQSLCLVLTDWDGKRAALVSEIDAWEIGLKLIVVTPDGRRPPGVPPAADCLSAGAIMRGDACAL